MRPDGAAFAIALRQIGGTRRAIASARRDGDPTYQKTPNERLGRGDPTGLFAIAGVVDEGRQSKQTHHQNDAGKEYIDGSHSSSLMPSFSPAFCAQCSRRSKRWAETVFSSRIVFTSAARPSSMEVWRSTVLRIAAISLLTGSSSCFRSSAISSSLML